MRRHDRNKKREKECVTVAMIFTIDHSDDRGDGYVMIVMMNVPIWRRGQKIGLPPLPGLVSLANQVFPTENANARSITMDAIK